MKIRSKKLSNLWSKFKADSKGHFAVTTAVLGLPLILTTGLAVDASRAYSFKGDLQSALDNAALAAVMPASLSETQRKDFALNVFSQNYFHADTVPVITDATASMTQVDIMATAEFPTVIGGMIGKKTFKVSETASAIITTSDVVCILALDPKGDRSLEFLDKTTYSSPACSVQANSDSLFAINSDVLTPPVASSFCSVGGSQGDYFPKIKNNCTPVVDPYANLQIPPAASSCDQRRQVVIRGNNGNGVGRSFLESQLARNVEGESIIPDHSVLSPGIYCRGLLIDGANVVLEPGVYHVWGDLEFTQFAGVRGDGVTFILKGLSNRLLIDEGAQVSLKAPSTGLTAGLVFWQKYLDFYPYIWGQIPNPPERVIATSEIRSGGGLHMVGTAYLPNHELIISSNNSVASQSPATSFIAYRIKFKGQANMQVSVDHEKGGIPPMLPRSDDGARLIQ